MFRSTSSKLAVGTYTRFLMENKGKHTGINVLKRTKLLVAGYKAVMAKPATRNALVKRAEKTFYKRKARKTRKAGAWNYFVNTLEDAKIINRAKNFAKANKTASALFKKYKTVARVTPYQSSFDKKIIRSL